jgi:hypothetical protein
LHERRHLLPPRIPKVWKAVDEHDKLACAQRGVMNFDAARIRVAMLDLIPEILRHGNSRAECENQQEHGVANWSVHDESS